MSAAVGCRPKDISRFVSRVRNHRGSPKKAQLVMDMIRGKTFEDARLSLQFSTKRAAVNVHKALMAAYAEAEELGADGNRLVVAESRVDGGLHIKRFQPKDRGRAHPILKRTSHITVGVQER
ncbi:MAG: 50S ribosomal protein L22 [Planctomycetota bacterium]